MEKPGVEQFSPEMMAAKVLSNQGIGAAIIDDGILVVYTVSVPWYADYRVLHELLVLRIGDGGTFRDVTDLLDDLAEQFDCYAMSAGTALSGNEKAIARMYQRAGWTIDKSLGLAKWRNNG